MSQATQALWFDAVPLLVVAAAYLGAAAVHARGLLAGGDRSPAALSLLSAFPVVAVAAAIYGIVLAVEEEPPVGGVWLTLGLSVLLLLPALAVLAAGPAADVPVVGEDLRSRVALAEALERERFVARISARVRSELDIDELLRVGVEETGTALGVDRCFIRLGRVGGIPTAQWQKPGLPPIESSRHLAVSNLATRRGANVAIEDVATAPELDDATLGGRQPLLDLGSRAVLSVPMGTEEDLIGVLSLHRGTTSRWTREEIALAEMVAREIGLAVRVAELLRENERRIAQQSAFFRIAAMLGQPLSRRETGKALAEAANDALGGSCAVVLLPHGDLLELVDASDLPHVLSEALANGLPESANCLRGAAQEGRVLASPDVMNDDRFEPAWQQLADAAGYRSLLAMPAANPRAERPGLVIVFFAEERLFTDEDLQLANHLGDAARSALARSELFEAERTARALSQQLARTGGVLATELDPAAVLDEVVQQAAALLSADAGAVRTVEDDELVVSAAWGKGAEEAVDTRVPVTGRLSGDVYQSRSPVAVEDAAGDDRLLVSDAILSAGYTAYLGVPLSGPEGTLAGVLAVYAARPRRWRAEEVEALLALAANTSAALSNAELYSRVSLEKERSVAILANIADGIVAVDRDGKVVLWNAAAEEITGVPQEEASGLTTVQVLQRELESGEAETQSGPRLVSIMRGGEEVWLSLSEAVMRDPLGAVAGRIFAFRDISGDLMVEQVKSDFVAAVSHELRTPLTSIYGFAETLLRQDILFGEEERRTFLGYIASESERLSEIVDELLNVARLDAGDLQVELGRIDVASVVSEVVGTVEESGVMNGHRFEVDLPPEPVAVQADPDKVRQVFNILVENAVRYSPNGGTVTVGARRNADRVEVRVVDEGIGIPASERDRIFRKFYRAESAARDGAAGTGLGLFIAKELVTAMGGRIWVDSTEGEGSSFSFELPAARE